MVGIGGEGRIFYDPVTTGKTNRFKADQHIKDGKKLYFYDSDNSVSGYIYHDGTNLTFYDTVAGLVTLENAEGAVENLSNLAVPTAINTSLISDTDNTDNLGSSSIFWKMGYLKGLTLDGNLVNSSGILTILPASSYTRIGDAGTTSQSLAANDDLFVSGKLEVDGIAYFDSAVALYGGAVSYDNQGIVFGNSTDAIIEWDTTQTVDTWLFGINTSSRSIIICEIDDMNFNFEHAAQTNPTLFIHSANQSTTEWIGLAHDQTDALITSGAGNIKLNPAGTDIDCSSKAITNATNTNWDAAFTHKGSNGSDHGFLDQSVISGASPTFDLPIIGGHSVLDTDAQLVAATFPNDTTLYIWNMDASSEDAVDAAYTGTQIGAKDLTVKVAVMASATDVLTASKYCQFDGSNYLLSTDAAFNIANVADTDDFIVGGVFYIPDMTPAARVILMGNTSDGAAHGYTIDISTAGVLSGNLWGGTDTAAEYRISHLPIGWYRIVFTREVGVGTVLYLNGEAVATAADTTIGETQSEFQVGGGYGANDLVEANTKCDEIFFKKGILTADLDQAIRKVYAKSSKKFAIASEDGDIFVVRDYNFDSPLGKSIDIVQGSDLNIASTNTLILTFEFVPSKIEITYSGNCEHDTSAEIGSTNGRAIIIITGTDTMTVNMNASSTWDNNGTWTRTSTQNETTNTIVVYGGHDGVDAATIIGVGTWDTSSKQLTITFTVANTTDATNFVELTARAYK